MRIMGIDPGYDRLGVALLEKVPGKETLLHSECFQTDRKSAFADRLHAIGEHTYRLIDEYSPTHMAIENVFFNTNQKTAMDVAAVRGVLLYIARERELAVSEYTPPQIKTAVGGGGHGSKKDVIAMVHHLVALSDRKRLDDEYDAIAVALTHSACVRSNELMS